MNCEEIFKKAFDDISVRFPCSDHESAFESIMKKAESAKGNAVRLRGMTVPYTERKKTKKALVLIPVLAALLICAGVFAALSYGKNEINVVLPRDRQSFNDEWLTVPYTHTEESFAFDDFDVGLKGYRYDGLWCRLYMDITYKNGLPEFYTVPHFLMTGGEEDSPSGRSVSAAANDDTVSLVYDLFFTPRAKSARQLKLSLNDKEYEYILHLADNVKLITTKQDEWAGELRFTNVSICTYGFGFKYVCGENVNEPFFKGKYKVIMTDGSEYELYKSWSYGLESSGEYSEHAYIRGENDENMNAFPIDPLSVKQIYYDEYRIFDRDHYISDDNIIMADTEPEPYIGISETDSADNVTDTEENEAEERQTRISIKFNDRLYGVYTFRYYVDDIPVSTEELDLAAADGIDWDFSNSGVHKYSMDVLLPGTQIGGRFFDCTVDFSTDPPTKDFGDTFKSNIFKKLREENEYIGSKVKSGDTEYILTEYEYDGEIVRMKLDITYTGDGERPDIVFDAPRSFGYVEENSTSPQRYLYSVFADIGESSGDISLCVNENGTLRQLAGYSLPPKAERLLLNPTIFTPEDSDIQRISVSTLGITAVYRSDSSAEEQTEFTIDSLGGEHFDLTESGHARFFDNGDGTITAVYARIHPDVSDTSVLYSEKDIYLTDIIHLINVDGNTFTAEILD